MQYFLYTHGTSMHSSPTSSHRVCGQVRNLDLSERPPHVVRHAVQIQYSRADQYMLTVSPDLRRGLTKAILIPKPICGVFDVFSRT
jgi:hypothetical protein